MQKAKEPIGLSKAKTGASKNLLGEIFCSMKQMGCYQMINSHYFVRQVCIYFQTSMHESISLGQPHLINLFKLVFMYLFIDVTKNVFTALTFLEN